MPKIVKVLITVIVVAAIYATTNWLLGLEAAGTALLVTCIIISGYVGTGWGGRQATKTHENRQELLYGRKANEAPTESGPEEDQDPKNLSEQ